MPVPSKSRFSVLSASLSKGAAAFVFLLGAAMLAGWVFDIALLKWTPQGMVGMKANTAFAFLLSGISLWLSAPEEEGGTWGKERIGRGLAFLVALLGLLTLAEYVFGWDLGIDQLLAREAPGALKTSSPGRMAPNTALDFLFLGGALLAPQRAPGRMDRVLPRPRRGGGRDTGPDGIRLHCGILDRFPLLYPYCDPHRCWHFSCLLPVSFSCFGTAG